MPESVAALSRRACKRAKVRRMARIAWPPTLANPNCNAAKLTPEEVKRRIDWLFSFPEIRAEQLRVTRMMARLQVAWLESW